MIKKLRKKFIAIAMCSMALVLFVIMAGINIANYTNVCRNADMRIHVIAENDGKFPENPADDTPKDDNQTPPEPKKEKELARRDISPESAFDTRFFTVTITDKGTVDQVDTGKKQKNTRLLCIKSSIPLDLSAVTAISLSLQAITRVCIFLSTVNGN